MPPVSHPTRRAALTAAAAAALLAAAPAHAAPQGSTPPVVTILGDSVTAGLGLPAADALPAQLQAALARLGARATVRGAGVSGDTTAGALARTDFSVQPDTAVCVIELGANDLFQSVPPADTERNLRAIIAKLQKRRIKVLLAAGNFSARSTGGYGRDFAALFPRVAKSTGVALTPDLLAGLRDRKLLQPDGLHPNAAGARLLADRLASPVARLLAAPRGR